MSIALGTTNIIRISAVIYFFTKISVRSHNHSDMFLFGTMQMRVEIINKKKKTTMKKAGRA